MELWIVEHTVRRFQRTGYLISALRVTLPRFRNTTQYSTPLIGALRPEVETMPDNKDDADNLVPFRLRKKSGKNGRKRQTDLRVDPVDVIASGTVIVALIFAVAMVSQWLPVNTYTMGIVACSGAGFVIAKLMKPRRPRASEIRFPRDRG
jgi:hypothetical protein